MSAAPRLRIVARSEPVVYVRPQTRLGSFVESLVNVVVGLATSLLTQALAFPYFGLQVPLHVNLQLTAIFAGVAVVRSTLVRRGFVAYRRRQARTEVQL